MLKIKLLLIRRRSLILAILFLVLGIYVVQEREVVGYHPFDDSYILTDPNESYQFNADNIYILDSGRKSIVVLDGEKNYRHTIVGGDRKDKFYQAINLAADNEGNLLVLDRLFDEGGKNVTCHRIGEYDTRGTFTGYLYIEEDSQTILRCIKYIDDRLYFAELGTDVIRVKELTKTGEVRQLTQSVLPCPNIEVIDVDISQDLDVVFTTVYGSVYETAHDGQVKVISYAGEEGAEYPYSLPIEAAYDSQNRIIVNDIGRKEILCLNRENDEIDTIVAKGINHEVDAELSFAQEPVYGGLTVTYKDGVSLVINEYIYDEEQQDFIYSYEILMKPIGDGELFRGYQFTKSDLFRIREWIWYTAVCLLLLIGIWAIVKVVRMCRVIKLEQSVKIQAAVLLTSVLVTIFVASYLINFSNERYISEVVQKMGNISDLITERLSVKEIKRIESPSDYQTREYVSLDEKVQQVLLDQKNKDSAIYCVIYKVVDNMISQVYGDGITTACGNIMAGVYEGSIEESVIDSGEPYVSYDYQSAEGSYMFVLSPIYNQQGDPIGLIEIGTDLYAFTKLNQSIFGNVLLFIVAILFVGMLYSSEILVFHEARKKSRLMRKSGAKRDDSTLSRMATFFICFIANMSTAFLPVYGKALWNPATSLPVEYASALPLTVELCFSSAASLVGGYLLAKVGTKKMGIIGALFYGISNLGCWYTQSFSFFIILNGISGIGGGLFTIAVSTHITGYDEKQKSRGFAHNNAAFLSGMNCGTVVGSLFADYLGYQAVFGIGAILSVIAVGFVVIGLRNDEKDKKPFYKSQEVSKISVFEFLKSRAVWKFFVCISIPYLICGSFLSYFFPVFGEANNLTTTQISMAFLLSGMISIYLGPVITEIISHRLSNRKAIILSSFLYVIAFGIYILNPSIESCFIAIAVLAAADSFGLTAQSVYFTSLPQVASFGEGKAMGINSLVEDLALALGPVIFATVLMAGIRTGLFIIVLVSGVMFCSFARTSGQLSTQ